MAGEEEGAAGGGADSTADSVGGGLGTEASGEDVAQRLRQVKDEVAAAGSDGSSGGGAGSSGSSGGDASSSGKDAAGVEENPREVLSDEALKSFDVGVPAAAAAGCGDATQPACLVTVRWSRSPAPASPGPIWGWAQAPVSRLRHPADAASPRPPAPAIDQAPLLPLPPLCRRCSRSWRAARLTAASAWATMAIRTRWHRQAAAGPARPGCIAWKAPRCRAMQHPAARRVVACAFWHVIPGGGLAAGRGLSCWSASLLRCCPCAATWPASPSQAGHYMDPELLDKAMREADEGSHKEMYDKELLRWKEDHYAGAYDELGDGLGYDEEGGWPLAALRAWRGAGYGLRAGTGEGRVERVAGRAAAAGGSPRLHTVPAPSRRLGRRPCCPCAS
jgi:hypothetical protein